MSDAMTPTPAELARSFMSEFANVDRVSFNFTNALGSYDTSNYSGDTARAALDAMLAKAREDALREAAAIVSRAGHSLDVEILALITKDKP